MKLVTVLMLMGAHCVSPVEHSQVMTDAAKVQCAVVIEKDTDRGTLTVTPPGASADPQVAAAVALFDAAPLIAHGRSGMRIVPARAAAGTAPVEVKPSPEPGPAAKLPKLTIAPPLEAAAPPPASPTATSPARPALDQAPPPKRVNKINVRKTKTVKASAAVSPRLPKCKGSAKLKWYATGSGQRKYHCVKAASVKVPAQLY